MFNLNMQFKFNSDISDNILIIDIIKNVICL